MNPIHLRTVADLIARQHTLGLYCHHCDRWSEAPLGQLANDGWGRTPIVKLRFRCAICDGPAQRQLRPPPMPAAQSRTGWIAPPSSYVPGASIRGTSAVEQSERFFLPRSM
jgi:hypothetical protein